jgi:uncharacterized lipoprotein YmbA
VAIEVNKFDGKFGDKARLDAWWTITVKDNKGAIIREHTSLETPVGNDYNDLVKKLDELLDKLSIKIAGRINSQ